MYIEPQTLANKGELDHSVINCWCIMSDRLESCPRNFLLRAKDMNYDSLDISCNKYDPP